MISWNEYDACIASHNERISRCERDGRSEVSPLLDRQQRGALAGTVAILAQVSSLTGALLITWGRWLTGGKRVAEVS
jgi:hypothetical protein